MLDTPLKVPQRRLDIEVDEFEERDRKVQAVEPRTPVARSSSGTTFTRRTVKNISIVQEERVVVRNPSRRRLMMSERYRSTSDPNLLSTATASAAASATANNSNRRRRFNQSSRQTVSARCPRTCRSLRGDSERQADASRQNARQPRRNTASHSTAASTTTSTATSSLSRWEHPEGIQRRPSLDNAAAPSRYTDDSSTTTSTSKDKMPQRPRRRNLDEDNGEDKEDIGVKHTRNQHKRTSQKSVDATLLGYNVDLEEMDASHDLFVPETPSKNNNNKDDNDNENVEENSFSHVPRKMKQRSSVGSNISSRSTSSLFFQTRRRNSLRNLPERASSCVALQGRRTSITTKKGIRRRNRSMDLTLQRVTGMCNSSGSLRGRRRDGPTATTATTSTTPTAPTRQMQSFSSVVLGGRNSKSFRLQRNTDATSNLNHPLRHRQAARRCRSMDLMPSLARRAPSPPPSPIPRQCCLEPSDNQLPPHRHDDDDVSHVMASLTQQEDMDDLSFFTHNSRGSNASSSSGTLTASVGRRGSMATLSSFPSLSNSQKSKQQQQQQLQHHVQKTPTNIVDLVENLDQKEGGEYIIFIGNKQDLASVKRGDGGDNDDDCYVDDNDDDGDDNSTYVSVGGATSTSMGFSGYVDRSESDPDDNKNHDAGNNRSNPSLGYRDPDHQDRKIQGSLIIRKNNQNNDEKDRQEDANTNINNDGDVGNDESEGDDENDNDDHDEDSSSDSSYISSDSSTLDDDSDGENRTEASIDVGGGTDDKAAMTTMIVTVPTVHQ